MKKPPNSNPARQSFMDQNLGNRIRERAYEIWTASGRMDGQAHHHWLAAEREILAIVAAPLPAPKRRAPTKEVRTFHNYQVHSGVGELTP
jgi:Protein of unknown function (DUF2934)